MFGKGFTLFKLFGFEVKMDLSWIILGLLIAWTLAQGLFPHSYQGFETSTYWLMGVARSLRASLFHSVPRAVAFAGGQKVRLMVVEGSKLAGVITLKDMMKLLSLKIDLED